MSSQREALRSYIFGVTRELVARGVIRARARQPLPEIIAAEAGTILGELRDDFVAVGGELGLTAVALGQRFIAGVAQRKIDTVIAGGVRAFADFFAPPHRRPRR